VNAHVIREDLVGCPVHYIAGLEGRHFLTEPLDDAGELDYPAVAADFAHANQNHVI
jgi:hypothetical protein